MTHFAFSHNRIIEEQAPFVSGSLDYLTACKFILWTSLMNSGRSERSVHYF